jgi:hypothetical protein
MLSNRLDKIPDVVNQPASAGQESAQRQRRVVICAGLTPRFQQAAAKGKFSLRDGECCEVVSARLAIDCPLDKFAAFFVNAAGKNTLRTFAAAAEAEFADAFFRVVGMFEPCLWRHVLGIGDVIDIVRTRFRFASVDRLCRRQEVRCQFDCLGTVAVLITQPFGHRAELHADIHVHAVKDAVDVRFGDGFLLPCHAFRMFPILAEFEPHRLPAAFQDIAGDLSRM